MRQSIGIFGGSFDPVHNGHIRLAEFMLDTYALDKMLIVPAAVSPFKAGVYASGEDRLNMCTLAFTKRSFEVSDIELKRAGRSYSVDTVFSVSEKYPDARLYLVVGSDQLLTFAGWRRFGDILGRAAVCAVSREGRELKEKMESYADKNLRRFGQCLISDFEPFETSSTEIRRAVREGKDISELVPDAVAAYIKEKGLYADE